MKTAKAIGLIVLGIVIGVLTSFAVGPVEAQSKAPRLLRIATEQVGSNSFSFIADTKANACWVVVEKSGAVSIAAAAQASCAKY
jgi:hypothetical protein